MKKYWKISRDRPILSEDDFLDSVKALWGELNVPWGYHLNQKHFHIYEALLSKFSSMEFTEEMEEETRLLWQIANSPLAKALDEED